MIIKKYFTTLFICLGVLIGNMALAASSASAADAWVYEKNGIDTYVVTDSVNYNTGFKAGYAVVDIKHVHHNSGSLISQRTFSFNHSYNKFCKQDIRLVYKAYFSFYN